MRGMIPRKNKPHFNCNKEQLNMCLNNVNELIFAYKNAEDKQKVKVLEEIYKDILQDFEDIEDSTEVKEEKTALFIRKIKKPKKLKNLLTKK